MQDDITDLKVAVARIEERVSALQPASVGSPINLAQAFQNSIASKQGILTMVIAAITGTVSSFFGAKVGS